MEQQARNVTMKDWGFPAHSRYLLHDGDGKFCPVLGEVIQAGKVKPPKLPAPLSEPECVCRVLGTLGERGMPVTVVFFGEHSLRRALTEYIDYFDRERNHQGKGNKLQFPAPRTGRTLPPGNCAMQRTTQWLTQYYEARAA